MASGNNQEIESEIESIDDDDEVLVNLKKDDDSSFEESILAESEAVETRCPRGTPVLNIILAVSIFANLAISFATLVILTERLF